MTSFNNLRPKGRLTKLGKKDVPLRVDTKFTGHKDTGQNFHDKEETNKSSSATVLKPLPSG